MARIFDLGSGQLQLCASPTKDATLEFQHTRGSDSVFFSVPIRHGASHTRLPRRGPPRPRPHRQPKVPRETSQRPRNRFEGVSAIRDDPVLVQSALRRDSTTWCDRLQASGAVVSTVSLAKEPSRRAVLIRAAAALGD